MLNTINDKINKDWKFTGCYWFCLQILCAQYKYNYWLTIKCCTLCLNAYSKHKFHKTNSTLILYLPLSFTPVTHIYVESSLSRPSSIAQMQLSELTRINFNLSGMPESRAKKTKSHIARAKSIALICIFRL